MLLADYPVCFVNALKIFSLRILIADSHCLLRQ